MAFEIKSCSNCANNNICLVTYIVKNAIRELNDLDINVKESFNEFYNHVGERCGNYEESKK